MQIEMKTAEPYPPPIVNVLITLNPEEALCLRQFLGRISITSIKQIIAGQYPEKVIDNVHALVSVLYDELAPLAK